MTDPPLKAVPPTGVKASVSVLLPCPKCGRRYSPDPAEAARAECCGQPLPLDLAVFAVPPELLASGPENYNYAAAKIDSGDRGD